MVKTHYFIWILLMIKALLTESQGEPCSQGPKNAVIDICSTRKIQEDDNTHNILLKATKRQECICKLIIKYNSPVAVTFRKYDKYGSSVPAVKNCGLELIFTTPLSMWNINCKIENQLDSPIDQSQFACIESFNRSGKLHENEGYCIEIVKKDADKKNNTLAIAIGLSVGCLLLVIVPVVVVTCIRFNRKRNSNESQTSTTESMHETNQAFNSDGLQYNVLYVSASVDRINDSLQVNNNQVSESAIDCTYSYVDLDKRSVEYSANDSKNTQDRLSTEIATTIDNKDKLALNLKTKNYVPHITAPGSDGCQYAVVDKTSRHKH